MNKKISNILFLCILIVTLVFRIIMVFYSPLQFTDADEAVIGIMAKHIMEMGEIHFFQIGHSFGGDMVVQSLIAVPFFIVFGISTLALHIEAIFLTALVVATAYLVFRRVFNEKVALLTALFLSIPSPVYVEFTRNSSWHIFPLTLDLLLFFFFYWVFFKKQASSRNLILFGLLSAFSIWVTEFSIPLIIIFIVYWFIIDRRFIFKRSFHAYILSFVIGSLPVIIYNITHKLSNIKHLFAQSFIHKIVCEYNLFPSLAYCLDEPVKVSKNIFLFFGNSLPSLFGESIFRFAPYLLILISISYIIHKNRQLFYSVILSFFRKNSAKTKDIHIPIEAAIIFYILLFAGLFYLRGADKPRYLLPAYPFFMLVIAIFIAEFSKKISNMSLKVIFLSTIILIIPLVNLNEASLLYKRPASEIPQILQVKDVLLANNVIYVYAEYWIKWPIIFESNEQIIASCDHMCYCLGEGRKSRYPKYEEIVNNSKNFGYVVREKSEYSRRFKEYLSMNNVSYNSERIGNFFVYYSLSKEIRPWMINCTDNKIMHPSP